MNRCILLSLLIIPVVSWSDNEIFVNQTGANANIDIEQLGSSNIIGGLEAVAGTMTALDLDGSGLTLDINQIGSSNKFLGDILGDSITGFFEFDGDSNIFEIQVDPDDTYGANSGNYNIDISGSTNEFELNVGTSALSDTLDLDWIINGDENVLNVDINYDEATNYVDIDGDSNTLDFTGTGAASGYFYLDHAGNDRTFNVQQKSTLASDWLKIQSVGSNGTVCVIQDDGGTSVSC